MCVCVMLNAFNSPCDWLECSCEKELFTLANVQKCKLVDRYGDHIVFAEISWKKNIVSRIYAPMLSVRNGTVIKWTVINQWWIQGGGKVEVIPP